MISNPAPIALTDAAWSVAGGINSFTVTIPTRPIDNDLAGIIIVGATSGSPAYSADVFYRGPWQEFITITTDAANVPLLPNVIYTINVAAYDEFGEDTVNLSAANKTAVTLQVIEADISTGAVTTPKVQDSAITDAKISSLTATKITAGTITGSTLQTSASGKRFVVSASGGEAVFYEATGGQVLTLGTKTTGYDDYIVTVDPQSNGLPQDGLYINTLYTALKAISDDGAAIVAESNSASDAEYTVIASRVDSPGGVIQVSGVNGGINIMATCDTSLTNGTILYVGTTGGSPFVVSTNPIVHFYHDHVGVSAAVLKVEITGNGDNNGSKTIQTIGGAADLSGGVVYFKSYTATTLPSAATVGGMIYVSNESGGAVMAFSDGTNWRRVTDRAVVS